MPLRWLRAHVEEMSRITADEAFRESEIMAVGSGSLSQRERNKVVRRWEAERARHEVKPVAPENVLSVLARLGFKVKMVERKGKP